MQVFSILAMNWWYSRYMCQGTSTGIKVSSRRQRRCISGRYKARGMRLGLITHRLLAQSTTWEASTQTKASSRRRRRCMSGRWRVTRSHLDPITRRLSTWSAGFVASFQGIVSFITAGKLTYVLGFGTIIRFNLRTICKAHWQGIVTFQCGNGNTAQTWSCFPLFQSHVSKTAKSTNLDELSMVSGPTSSYD